MDFILKYLDVVNVCKDAIFPILTGCPSFGICTMECLEGATFTCLPHTFNLSRCVMAAKITVCY